MKRVGPAIAGLLIAATTLAQGPGSCGFHLDILANVTSTHSAIADVQFAPGSGAVPYPPGFPGNPYAAYAMPGSMITLRVTVAPSLLGVAPIGATSRIALFWGLATPNIVFPVPAGAVPPCWAGQGWVVSVMAGAGGPLPQTMADGIGIWAPPPPTPPADPGHPYKFEMTVFLPAFMPAGPVMFQAALMTPQNLVAITNGVALMAGPNPAEVSLLPQLVAACPGFNPLDEGVTAIPAPPGFTFYGFPAPMANVYTNGFVDFMQGIVAPVCDFTGSSGDLGCPPPTGTATPRIGVNHFDVDFTVPVTPPRISDLTMEIAPPGPGWPTRHIIRWKNAAPFGSPAAPPSLDTDYASMVVELWGADFPGGQFIGPSSMIVVRQQMHPVTTMSHHDLIGIGPGLAGQGFGGPPAQCLAIPMWTIWGARPGLIGPIGAGMFQDTVFDSSILSNLAVVFMPQLFMPVLPTAYSIDVY